MPENYTGSNAQYGRKRKRGGASFNLASKLSRRLFFKGTRPAEPQISSMVFDKMVNRALKRKNISEPEQKYFEISADTTISNVANGTQVLINGSSEGDTESTRTGIRIKTTKIEFIAHIQMSVDAAGGSDNGKVALYVHKQVNTAAGNFSLGSGSGGLAPYWLGARAGYPLIKAAMQNDNYYIIRDFDYSLDAKSNQQVNTSGTTTDNSWQSDCQVLKCEVPISRIVQYNGGNAGTVADIITNAFYLGYGGGQAAGATATVMSYIVRLWYTDM